MLDNVPLGSGSDSTAFVSPPAVIHVTSTSLPCSATAVTWKGELLSFGLVPRRNSWRLDKPSASGSAVATLESKKLKPHCCFQLFGIPSPNWLLFGSRIGWTDGST